MLSIFRRLPISRFRENPGKHLKWVEAEGGHLWLTRHGRHVAAVIPFYQMEMLDALLGHSHSQKVEALEQDYTRFRAAKSIQAQAEKARLEAGETVGGTERTRAMREQLESARDPWLDDPILVTIDPPRRGPRFEE